MVVAMRRTGMRFPDVPTMHGGGHVEGR